MIRAAGLAPRFTLPRLAVPLPRMAVCLACLTAAGVGIGTSLVLGGSPARLGSGLLAGSLLLLLLGELGIIGIGRQEVALLAQARQSLLLAPLARSPWTPADRQALPDRLEAHEAIAAAMQRVPAQALLMLGIRRLQALRDTHGEATLELLEEAMAVRIRQLLRRGDMVARTREGELAVLPSDVADAEGAGVLAARLVEHVGGRYVIEGRTLTIGIRLGLAMAPMHGTDPALLMRQALVALRVATAQQGWWRAYEPHMLQDAAERAAMESDLAQAMAHDQFELHYQPLIDLTRDRVGGFEALLRWRHPQRGTVQPAQFIALAEESGHITRIGAWVLERACRDAMEWPADIRVAVNLSAVQVRGEGLLAAVRHAIDVSGLLPARLELEVTETVLLEGDTASRRVMHELRAMGVRIAMDDFGTGHSSLSYLRDFPFDKIKIDRSFVQHIGKRADCLAIVRAVTGLAASLGISVTAEGAEDAETVERLREEGCAEVQGYYYSRPVPMRQTAALLHRDRVTSPLALT